MKFLTLTIVSLFVLVGCDGSGSAAEVQNYGRPFGLGEPYTHAGTNQYEMSAKSFVPANGSGPKITLVGMIHIGESSYYHQVQKRIDRAGRVLWENIGDPAGDSYDLLAGAVPACQTLSEFFNHNNTASQLGLVNQQLYYPHDTEIWADVGSESLLNLFLNTPFAQERQHRMPNSRDTSKCYQVLWLFNEGFKEKPNPDFGSIDLLGDPSMVQSEIRNAQQRRAQKLNRQGLAFFSKNRSDSNQFFPGFREVLLERRNDVVLQKLQQTLQYNSGGEILIVYGAAHMPDIEKRFTAQHNYVPHLEERLVAFTF